MKKLFAITLLLTAVVVVVSPVRAQDKPIQLSLWSPVQIFSPNQSIAGLRISLLYGKNVNMTGLDWGLVTKTTGNMVGIQSSLVGMVDGNATGIQWNFVSLTKGDFTGLQYGVFNSAGHVEGIQIGWLYNKAESMKGIQLGLLNFIHKGGWLPFFPIINGSF